MDSTLPDDAWKDSFDKLLDPIPRLRELNILKQNVRASYNIDSSVENSNPSLLSISDCVPENPTLKDTGICGRGVKLNSRSISTPATKRLSKNLFDCAISPITGIKLDGLTNVINQRKSCSGQLDILVHEKELPKPRKRVCFELSVSSICEIPVENGLQLGLLAPDQNDRIRRSSIIWKPGKWRKSLCNWRRTQLFEPARFSAAKQSLPAKQVASDQSVEYLGIIQMPGNRKSVYIKEERHSEVSYEGQVLRYCGQCKALRFDKTYTPAKMPNSYKIGEGVYGEVFKYTTKSPPKTDFVLKVIPIQGSMQINGETQKTYEQILPEIIISKEMCNLRLNKVNCTAGFVDIHKVSLVTGNYPKHLIELWEKYDDDNESENDHPKVFMDGQLFVVLELKFAGEDMSKFTFSNAEQAYYAFQQIILTLAVGEKAYQFEHRDLHWGNILIEATDKKQIAYKLDGKSIMVPTKGVKITIIDYTLSRITFDECCYYNDLSNDEELFSATGDYQYDIYRMMRDELKNDWTKFAPKTNVMWLSYVNAKLVDGVKYKSVHIKKHITYMNKLKDLQNVMLLFDSAANCVNHVRELM